MKEKQNKLEKILLQLGESGKIRDAEYYQEKAEEHRHKAYTQKHEVPDRYGWIGAERLFDRAKLYSDAAKLVKNLSSQEVTPKDNETEDERISRQVADNTVREAKFNECLRNALNSTGEENAYWVREAEKNI